LRSLPSICGYHDYYGHGVGMCQWGANVMADQGATSAEIAEHYYTNCKVSGAPEPPPEKANADIWTWNNYGELPGVAITLGDRYGITDSGGYLRFEDMLPGAYGLGARKEGYEEIARGETLLPGENEIDIAMEKEVPPEPPRPVPWWCPYATAFADWLNKLIACKCGLRPRPLAHRANGP